METVSGGIATVPQSSMLLVIDEQSRIGAARRAAVGLAHSSGLGEEAIGRLAIVVTEAATNILRHAQRGAIILRGLMAGDIATIEILALDKGPGIPDVARAMRDGFSTSGTAGQGLGGIQRLSDVFEVYSQRDKGTAILARVSEGARSAMRVAQAEALDDRIGVVCVPIRGETECGDDWRIAVARQRISVLVVDGLGHGPNAATAAASATARFPQVADRVPELVVAELDNALRDTRGAALSVAVIDEGSRTARFCGVGNVEARVIGGQRTEHFILQNGIVGHTMPTLRAGAMPWPEGGRLVMHSDGISARWHPDSYPGLTAAHPALMAGVIYRDFARERDDATVLVLCDASGEVPRP